MPDIDVAKSPVNAVVPKLNVPNLLRFTGAVCYYIIQGRTLHNKRILLLDTGFKHFTCRTFMFGLSRVTHGSHVRVVTKEMEERE